MLDIKKLQTIHSSNEQIMTAKRIYQDLEKSYDLELFVKPNHIRIYVEDWGWLSIAKSGRISSHLHPFQEGKIMEKLTPETIALLIKKNQENTTQA